MNPHREKEERTNQQNLATTTTKLKPHLLTPLHEIITFQMKPI